MALSNTATPIYYGRFRDAVMRGEIPVNEYIAMEMNRIDDLIANPGVWYDDQAINGFISYCENDRKNLLNEGVDVISLILQFLFDYGYDAKEIIDKLQTRIKRTIIRKNNGYYDKKI